MFNEEKLLELPNEVFDDWIRDIFPQFQKSNREASSEKIRIDFSRCEWVSPLPVLAMATELMSFTSAGRTIEIDLGEGASSDEGSAKRWRTLKYLSSHGFLDAFTRRDDAQVRFQFDKDGIHGNKGMWYEGRHGLEEVRKIIDRSRVELIYEDSVVLPATIWKLPSSNSENLTELVRSKIREMLKQADNSLFKFKTESRKYRDVTLQRLNQVLLELVENAAEHAYLDIESGYVGLYARIRRKNRKEAESVRGKEISNSPLLSNILLHENQQQIEVFVSDVGRGLFADIDKWPKKELRMVKGGENQPLRNTADSLFLRPFSRHDRTSNDVARLRGKSTGLMHLNNILSHGKGNDRSRIVTGREWIAGPHPRPPGFQNETLSRGGYRGDGEFIFGTFYHLGISPSLIPVLNSQWFGSDRTDSEKIYLAIAKKFAATRPPVSLKSRVIDIRNGEGLKSVQNRIKDQMEAGGDGVVVRVNRVAEKNLVNRIVVSWLEGSSRASRYNSVLYLCDLGRYQAIDTVWVVEQLFSKGGDRHNLEGWNGTASIFLVTEDLCCTELKVNISSRRNGTAQIKINRASADISKLENRIVFLLEQLRVCDSAALWKRVHELDDPNQINPILLQNVLWPTGSEERVLPYYLNFIQLIQDEEAARCVRRSLRRVLALFPQSRHNALDSLIGSSLHDAKKWLIDPPKNSNDIVLVGSLSVSGSTLSRYRLPIKSKLMAIVDSVRTPYYSDPAKPGSAPHLAALLWDASLKTYTDEAPIYRRVDRSAYIERMESNASTVEYDEKLYDEIESARLVKIGHWTHGDRHSLLELNAEIAIEQSGASESGAIPYLVSHLSEICKTKPVVLAFPIDKLAYRLAHHLKSRLELIDSNLKDRMKLLPISFLPRFAGGLTRFSPLVLDAARQLAETAGQPKPMAVFLDFGFITNRTVRHVLRQLIDAGFEEVGALGLINRSSAPELPSEKQRIHKTSNSFPVTYWRWNVPTLGTGAHCPLCGVLPAVANLRRIVESSHRDLLGPLEKMGEAWRPKEITDYWEEFGLEPLPIREEIRSGLQPILKSISNSPAYLSSTLASRSIEYLRATGDVQGVLEVARFMLDLHGPDYVAELVCVILLLASGSLTIADRVEFISLLLKATVALTESSDATESQRDRNECLLGLVTLTLAAQPVSCKISTLADLTRSLNETDVTDSPAVRLAIVALTTDADVSTGVEEEFERLCSSNSPGITLRRNFYSLRPSKGTIPETWYMLDKAFGRSSSHSQQSELGNLRLEITTPSSIAGSTRRLNRLASLLAQCDHRFLEDTLGLDVGRLLLLIRDLKAYALTEGVAVATYLDKVDSTFSSVIGSLHKSLVRYGDRASPLVYNVFLDLIEKQLNLNGLIFLKDVYFTKRSLSLAWPEGVGDYFPLGEQISRLFGEIFSNIEGKSASLKPPNWLIEFSDMNEPAKAWIWFDETKEASEHGISVVITTGLPHGKKPPPYRPKVVGLDDFGVIVSSSLIADCYFEIRVRIPSFASILEMINE